MKNKTYTMGARVYVRGTLVPLRVAGHLSKGRITVVLPLAEADALTKPRTSAHVSAVEPGPFDTSGPATVRIGSIDAEPIDATWYLTEMLSRYPSEAEGDE